MACTQHLKERPLYLHVTDASSDLSSTSALESTAIASSLFFGVTMKAKHFRAWIHSTTFLGSGLCKMKDFKVFKLSDHIKLLSSSLFGFSAEPLCSLPRPPFSERV